MNFEELKVIWNSQAEEPLYVVNENGLHQILREKSERLNRFFFWQEAQTYGSSLFVLLCILGVSIATETGFTRRTPTAWDLVGLLCAATGWLYFTITVYLSRAHQKRNNDRPTHSLREEVARDLRQVEFEIDQRKHIVRGYIPPYAGGLLLLWVFFRITGCPDWMIAPFIPIMIVAMFFESRGQRQIVERDLMPRKRELEHLRDKLDSLNAGAA